MKTLPTLSSLLVQMSLEETPSAQVSALSFLFCIRVGDGLSNSLQPKIPLDNSEMFLSILSLVYSLLFQGGSFNLGQSKQVLPGKMYGNAIASKRTESACTWKWGAGPAPTWQDPARGGHQAKPSQSASPGQGRLFYFSGELGQSRVPGDAAPIGSSRGASPTALALGTGSAPGSPCRPSPWEQSWATQLPQALPLICHHCRDLVPANEFQRLNCPGSSA